jgi:hypothetical protein
MIEGALTTTVGEAGFEGARVRRVTEPATKLEEHDASFNSQNALISPGSKVTLSPMERYTRLLAAEEITPNVATTLVALIQVHVVLESPVKEKRELHGQLEAVIPAESVAVSKSIRTD